MQAVRVHPNHSDPSAPFSAANPAPVSAIHIDIGIPIPQAARPGELLIRVRATTVIRDALTWPETYSKEYTILGHDFSGTVMSVYDEREDSPFKPGDEVYGMAHADRGGTWAEYVVVKVNEACLKPKRLTWAEAAAVPLSGLTAYQALFEKAEVRPLDLANPGKLSLSQVKGHETEQCRLLVTGAAGGVGTYLVQLGRLAGLYVVAATSSNCRNKKFLESLGASETVEYADLQKITATYSIIIDTVGGHVLESCWELVKDGGKLISIDSASYNFVELHRKSGLSQQKTSVKALFFIVTPSREGLEQLSIALGSGLLTPFVSNELALADARLAYQQSVEQSTGRGKIVLIP
ncbi:uncharacterized protein A1O9_11510 [Exophiala aquamarina CBS 119918]|uniref:Enoyl reductase (ER) domain-containing protein n=1 Tax=Exophiala aquamarina CBS 119918 TaxID=1182545 RepID=A0A072P9S4_9EURO|nr:uncharacterized protein A1O9_11510 [Exophiala aquamarina CBS 119918]KEF52270.1 hypothetical protein A1O9_11510 [Exophiala aquamarina CBS 119918]